VPGTIDKSERPKRARFLLLATIATAVACWAAATADAAQASASAPPATGIVYAPGQIVPLPASIPHEEGDMVDRRIVPDLRWIGKRFAIYVVDGYSGRLPNGEHVGCHGCHVKHSDHYNGLAVDLVPLNGSGRCDATWSGITRLAQWAEPVQNSPRAPFRWVGYDGDAGHGCGNHLHLSWEHAPAPMFQLAEWVEVFPVRLQGVARQPEAQPAPQPRGGVSVVQSGGIGAGD
jgi:hypothetical protein